MTNVKFIQQQQIVTMHKVTAIIGISKDAYYSYLYDAAVEWLLDHLHNDTDVVDDVMQCDVFWSWWFVGCYHRDNEWLNTNACNDNEAARLLNDWLYYHSASRLCDMQNKHAQLLYNGYANINWKQPNEPAPLSTTYISANGNLTYKYN
jgi:hypothetical protein